MPASTTRVVVGVDDSRAGRAALDFALREAARRGAEVHVVTAVEEPVDWYAVHGLAPEPGRPSPEQHREAVAARIATIVDAARAELAEEVDVAPIVTVAAVPGPAAPALLRAARGAEMLVVGTRRRRAGAVVLGSVSRHCLLHAPCPVTTVRAVDVPRPVPTPP